MAARQVRAATGGVSMKTRRHKTKEIKRRKEATVPRRRGSSVDLQQQLDRRSHELADAQEQLTTTAEILEVIRNSLNETQPASTVRATMVPRPGAIGMFVRI